MAAVVFLAVCGFITPKASAQTDVNQPPIVKILSPQAGAIFGAGADITVWTDARDADGSVKTVEFFANNTSLGIVTNNPLALNPVNPFHLTWPNVPPGEFALTAKATDNAGASATSDPINIKVFDDSLVPVVNLEVLDNIAAEPNPLVASAINTARFVVRRSSHTNEDLTVYYGVGGTASNGVDYARLSGQVVIPAGSASADIIVQPLNDQIVESAETVVIKLDDPPNCPPVAPLPDGCYLVGRLREVAAFILDNDQPVNQPPNVALVSPPDGAVFIGPTDIRLIASATDTDGWVRTVEFFDGTNSLGVVTNYPILIEPLNTAPTDIDFPLPWPVNPFTLVWADAPPGHHVLTALATDNLGSSAKSEPVEITILEEPIQPVVTVIATDPIASEGASDPGTTSADNAPDPAVFTIHRTGGTNFPMTVFYKLSGTASNGVDYQELPSNVVIPEGERSVDVVVTPIDDTLAEGAESVLLTIEAPICPAIFPPPPDCYIVGRASRATAIIYDNDRGTNQPPLVRILEPADGEVFRAHSDIWMTAMAWDADGSVVSVEFFEGTNSLGFGKPLPQPLRPCPIGTDCWFPPTFGLVWSNVPPGDYTLTAVATDDQKASAISKPVQIKVVDVKLPPVVSIVTTDPEAAEIDPRLDIPTNPAIFTVSRNRDTNSALTVYYKLGGTAQNGVDYDELPGKVTVPEGAWSADIFVNAIDDDLVEGTETVIAQLVPPGCVTIFPPPESCYIVNPTNNHARAVILDNDRAPTNLPPVVRIVRPEDGDVFKAPANFMICAEARDMEGSVKTVEFFANGISVGLVMEPEPNTEHLYCLTVTNVPPGEYALTAKAVDNLGASTMSAPVHIKVVLPPFFQVVTIRAVDPIAIEPNLATDVLPDTAKFEVRRCGSTNFPAFVSYKLSGTASNGVDYVKLSGEVIIPAGELSAPIVVVPLDDNLVEGSESVEVTLVPTCPACMLADPPCLPPLPYGGCYFVGEPGHALAYILDNDSPSNQPPRVEIARPHDGEVFIAPADIRIDVVTRDPDGYVPLVEFFAGTNKIGEVHVDFIVPPPPGETQTFTFDWQDVPPGNYVLTARATDSRSATSVSGPVHITVVSPNVLPVVTIIATDPVTSEGGSKARFLVHRTGSVSNSLLVHYSVSGTASNGVDYTMLPGQVTIPEGKETAEIFVQPIDDTIVEEPEWVLLKLEEPDCAATVPPPPGCYRVGEPGKAFALILDNDPHENLPPHVEIARPYSGQVFQAPANIPIVVAARDPNGWVHTVEFFANGVKIGEQSIEFIIAPPPGQLQTFEFDWENVPAGEYVLTARATDDQDATAMSRPVKIVVIEANRPPLVTIRPVDCIAIEGTPPNTASFRVRRTGGTNDPLTVFYSASGTASNGVDYNVLTGNVIIPAGRHTARITITPIDDHVAEGIETVIVKLEPSPTASPIDPYHVGYPNKAGAIILDNDTPRPLTHCLPDGLFHVCVPAVNGFVYRLEGTADLTDWTTLCDGAVVDGAIHFVDAEMPDLSHRFYRVQVEVDAAVETDD